MRLGRAEIRGVILLNYTILSTLCTYLVIKASLNIVTTTYPLLHNLPRQQTSTGCNGRTEYCSRTYDNVTQIGTHGSPFFGIMPSHNQNYDIIAQLDAGIRFLQAQTHRGFVYGELKLCHTSCLMADGGSLEAYLVTVKDWLEAHPHEIVTLLLTNGDFLDVGAFEEVFVKAGMMEMVYTPTPPAHHNPAARKMKRNLRPERSEDDDKGHRHDDTSKKERRNFKKEEQPWPTLDTMLARNQRLVVFLDYGAKSESVPYILNEFDHFWETAYDTTDPTFSQCAVDRPRIAKTITSTSTLEEKEEGERRGKVQEKMYILNHYLDTRVAGWEVPNRRDAKRTNAAEGERSIGAQARLCERVHGRMPRVVLVDYFDKGEVFTVQDRLNGFG